MAPAASDAPLVLVTGVSGFLASHIAAQLLAAGYRVRGTVRSVASEAKVRHLRHLVTGATAHALELVEADLTSAAGWDAAVSGATYVLHIASPLPIEQPKDEMELIGPARDAAPHALRADAAARPPPRRGVMTSYVPLLHGGLGVW